MDVFIVKRGFLLIFVLKYSNYLSSEKIFLEKIAKKFVEMETFL
jgi:hypothetical protein